MGQPDTVQSAKGGAPGGSGNSVKQQSGLPQRGKGVGQSRECPGLGDSRDKGSKVESAEAHGGNSKSRLLGRGQAARLYPV